MGEQQHATIQIYLGAILFLNAKAWHIRPLTEQRIQTSETHFRVADLCALRAGDPADPIVTKAPLLCIEILSPENRIPDMQIKVNDYAAMGVQHIWIIDPIRRAAFTATPQGFQSVTEAFLIPNTPIRIPIADIFHQLDLLAQNT